MTTSFKEWLNEDKLNEAKKKKPDNKHYDALEGSLSKLIEMMKGKKDDTSKEILKQAKGTLKKLKKDGGISSDSAEWLANTWASFKFK